MGIPAKLHDLMMVAKRTGFTVEGPDPESGFWTLKCAGSLFKVCENSTDVVLSLAEVLIKDWER